MIGTHVRASFVLLIATSSLFGGEQWPQFRGPSGNGRSAATGLPVRWGETQNTKWKTPIHDKGWSSPVIWDRQIWLTTALADGKQLFAICVDMDSGEILHDVKVFDIENPQYCIERNSYASCTPVIEQGRVYVHFGAHGTACLDTSTGKVHWTRQDLPCNHHRGPASSPILYDDLLVLTFDGFDLQYVVALDKKSGKTVWKRDRNINYGSDNGDVKKAYGTPQVVDINGTPQLISPSAAATIAYDVRTGDEIWRVRCGGMNVSARPCFSQGMLFINTEGGFRMFAMTGNGQGDVTDSHVVWKFAKGVPKHSSLLPIDDLILMSGDQGILTCLEAKSGTVVWQERVGGEFTASPIYANGRAYFFGEHGRSTVIQPGREFKLLATNILNEGCMASPAVGGKALIVRTLNHLYRIEE